MTPWALLAAAPLLAAHALGACTGLNAADPGTCPAYQCQALAEDFASASALGSAFVSEQSPDHASVESGSLVLSLVRSGSGFEGSTVFHPRWIHFGTVTAVVRSGSTASGVVSSFQLQDEDGSSIDMDWVGASSNRVQANFYTHGQVDLSQAAAPILSADPTGSFIEYKLVWLPDTLTWYANGLAVRTVNRRDTWAEGDQRFNYPSKPARLSFAIWDASASANPALTQAWAGTIDTDESQFSMAVKSVTVECYSNGTARPPSGEARNEDDNTHSLHASHPTTDTAENLLSFGLSPAETTTGTSSSTSSSTEEPQDDLSRWLAGLDSSAMRRQGPFGTAATLLAALSLALVLGV